MYINIRVWPVSNKNKNENEIKYKEIWRSYRNVNFISNKMAGCIYLLLHIYNKNKCFKYPNAHMYT